MRGEINLRFFESLLELEETEHSVVQLAWAEVLLVYPW